MPYTTNIKEAKISCTCICVCSSFLHYCDWGVSCRIEAVVSCNPTAFIDTG